MFYSQSVTKVMVILLPRSSVSEWWPVNHTLTYENYEYKFPRNIKFLGEIPHNGPKLHYRQMYTMF